ncbi:MAG: hypothetical protein HC869_17860, partial [Rhodospirillales bacterium]|nr:hypothetical protein [Rhodospirillales bacterium]
MAKTYDWWDAPAAEAAGRTLRQCLDTYPGGGLAAEVRDKLAALDAGEAKRLADQAAQWAMQSIDSSKWSTDWSSLPDDSWIAAAGKGTAWRAGRSGTPGQ